VLVSPVRKGEGFLAEAFRDDDGSRIATKTNFTDGGDRGLSGSKPDTKEHCGENQFAIHES
jgi:hypothetical protein